MYSIVYTNQFRKSLKRCVKRGLDVTVLTTAVNILQEQGCLPAEYGVHKLKGDYVGCWECHLEPDWLPVWRQNDKEQELIFVDTGTLPTYSANRISRQLTPMENAVENDGAGWLRLFLREVY